MGDSTLQNYAIGIVLFAAIILGGMQIMGAFINDNNTYIDEDNVYYKSFNSMGNKAYNNTQDIAGEYGSSINSTGATAGGDGSFIDSLIGGSWKTIQNFGASFAFMTTIFSESGQIFGIPSWVTGTIIAVIIISIVFAIFSAIFQRKL